MDELLGGVTPLVQAIQKATLVNNSETPLLLQLKGILSSRAFYEVNESC